MSGAAGIAPLPPSSRLAWSRMADWICAAGLLGLWLFTRPYRGVRHDAILYTGQVLAKLLPERIGTDLFFVYGSQDKYSLFSTLMAPLVASFGIGFTELALLALCNLLFMLACWQLMRPWLPRPLCWLGLMFVVVLPHTYGGLGEFSYAEPFLTARSFAEPFALFALGQLLRGRLAIALAYVLPGVALHPLIMLPALVIGWGVLIQQSRAWLWLVTLLAVPIALALLGLLPFSGLLQRFDGQWLDAVQGHDAHAFIVNNGVLDWAALVFDAVVLALCVRLESAAPMLRRLILSTLVAAAAGTVLWGLGADLMHDVLLTQLQLWRVYWPMHLLAMGLLPTLGVAYWRRGPAGQWCVAALGLAAISVLSNWDTGWICIIWALLALAVDFAKVSVSRTMVVAATAASFLAMLAITFRVAQVTQMAVDRFPDRFAHVVPAMIILGLPLAGAMLALALVGLVREGGAGRVAAAALAVAGALFGVGVWDQRSAWQLRLESPAAAATPVFDTEIPMGATVYWDESLINPWLLARRANFFSHEQGAGLLFNRAAALEYARREQAMAPLEEQRELCRALAVATIRAGAPSKPCVLSPAAVTTICREPVHPDYLVFAQPVDMTEVAEWHDVPPRQGAAGHSFHLYSCAELR